MGRRRSPRKEMERATRAFDRVSPPNPLHGEAFDGVGPGDHYAGLAVLLPHRWQAARLAVAAPATPTTPSSAH